MIKYSFDLDDKRDVVLYADGKQIMSYTPLNEEFRKGVLGMAREFLPDMKDVDTVKATGIFSGVIEEVTGGKFI